MYIVRDGLSEGGKRGTVRHALFSSYDFNPSDVSKWEYSNREKKFFSPFLHDEAGETRDMTYDPETEEVEIFDPHERGYCPVIGIYSVVLDQVDFSGPDLE